MEDLPLNKAHLELRLAYNNETKRNYSEAIENHERAEVYFKEAMTCTNNDVIKTSLDLQLQNCQRRLKLLRHQKVLASNIFKNLASVPKPPAPMDEASHESFLYERNPTGVSGISHSRVDDNVASLVLKNSHEMVNLIYDMQVKLSCIESSGSDVSSKASEQDTERKSSINVQEIKEMMESVRVHNMNNVALMEKLSGDVGSLLKENYQLKTKVLEMQNQLNKLDEDGAPPNSGSTCSPFVFSPMGEYSPIHSTLPDLPPLEMPAMDYLEDEKKESV